MASKNTEAVFGDSTEVMAVSNSRRRPLEGGYQCEFVEKPKELQSECSICLSILCEPYTVDCCGNKFCRTCIKRVEDDNRPCPLCNVAFTSVPDRQLERQLKERSVYCNHKDKGCNWIGELRQLKQHLNPEASLDSVQEICDFQDIQCSRCQQYVERKKLNIPCPHLLSEPCPYKYVGCTFKTSKPELEAHLQQNIAYHTTLAARKTEALDAGILTINTELEATKQKSQTLREELQASTRMSETLREKLETTKRTTQINCITQGVLMAILLLFVAGSYYQNKTEYLSNRVEKIPMVRDFERDLLELKVKIDLLSVTPRKEEELSEVRENAETVVKKLNQKVGSLTKTTTALEISTHSMLKNITELNVKTDIIETATQKLNTAVKQLDQEMKALEGLSDNITKVNARTDTLDTVEDSIQELKQTVQGIVKTKTTLNASTSLLPDSSTVFNKLGAVETAIQKLNTTVEQLSQEVTTLDRFTHSISGNLTTSVDDLRGIQITNLTAGSQEHVLNNKPTSKSLREPKLPILPVYLTLSSFHEYRDNGSVWHSPPFYTSEGHKLILTVDLNGEDTVGHKHTELSLKTLSEESEQHTEWQYEANFTIELSYNITVLGDNFIFTNTKNQTALVSCTRSSHIEYIQDGIRQLQLTVSAASVPQDSWWTEIVGWIMIMVCKLIPFVLPHFIIAMIVTEIVKDPLLKKVKISDVGFALLFFCLPPITADIMIYYSYELIGYTVLVVYTTMELTIIYIQSK